MTLSASNHTLLFIQLLAMSIFIGPLVKASHHYVAQALVHAIFVCLETRFNLYVIKQRDFIMKWFELEEARSDASHTNIQPLYDL